MTAVAQAAVEAPRIDVGWVVRATWRICRDRAWQLFLLSVPFVVIPQALAGLLPQELSRLGVVAGLPALVFGGGATLMGYRTLTDGEPLSAWEAARAGGARFGSLWGLGFISSIGVGLGILLLVVPGVILLAGWLPATAVLMVEQKTTYASLDRSWALSRGSRWRLAGLLGLAVVATAGILIAAIAVGLVITLTAGEPVGDTLMTFAMIPLVVAMLQAVFATGATAAYVALRRAKEGVSDVATVFD